jgi:DNA-binding transcriptional MocR family regulator
VFTQYQNWQLELERNPVEFLGRRSGDLLWRARETLATYLGAAPADLVFVSNATTGVNIVARSLVLSPGDEVLSTDHEYGGARPFGTSPATRSARTIGAYRSPCHLIPRSFSRACWRRSPRAPK